MGGLHAMNSHGRRVKVDGHQESWIGVFHAWGIDHEGKSVAIIETASGNIVLRHPGQLIFIDPLTTESNEH